MKIKPYTIHIPNKTIDDLKIRLGMTRFPDEIPDTDWQYGIPLALMKEMVHYWEEEFDWRKVEKKLNAFSNYKVNIDGIDIHFIYERGSGENSIPILIPHGYPGSIYDMLELIPYLTTPEKFGGESHNSFDVIIPSIPGHGFSESPLKKKFEDRQVANIFLKLMKLLDYEKFGAHGYDLGASILGLLCLDHPESVIGYHTTSPGNPSPFISEDTITTKPEKDYLSICKQWYSAEGGYAHILGTKPQTSAYSLNDSPIGLAAFILEKWYLWTLPPNDDLFEQFDKETLMANVSIYWFTQTINSANRFYFEGKHTKWPDQNDFSVVPLGVSLTATQSHERPPKEYVERLFPNIVFWKELNTGGHFVATENPQLVAKHIQEFFNMLL